MEVMETLRRLERKVALPLAGLVGLAAAACGKLPTKPDPTSTYHANVGIDLSSVEFPQGSPFHRLGERCDLHITGAQADNLTTWSSLRSRPFISHSPSGASFDTTITLNDGVGYCDFVAQASDSNGSVLSRDSLRTLILPSDEQLKIEPGVLAINSTIREGIYPAPITLSPYENSVKVTLFVEPGHSAYVPRCFLVPADRSRERVELLPELESGGCAAITAGIDHDAGNRPHSYYVSYVSPQDSLLPNHQYSLQVSRGVNACVAGSDTTTDRCMAAMSARLR